MVDSKLEGPTWAELAKWAEEHRDKRVVIKYGAVIEHESLRENIAEEIFLSSVFGMRPNIVHGGSTYITRELEGVFPGYKPQYTKDGDRVTPKGVAEIVHRVLGGITNEIAELLRKYTRTRQVVTVGTSLEDALFVCRQKSEEAQCVGEIEDLKGGLLSALYARDVIPVICPAGYGIGETGEKQRYNINGDRAAAYLASYQHTEGDCIIPQASKLIFITDVNGVYDAKGRFISKLTIDEAEKLMHDGVIEGGMIPKVAAGIDALKAGVSVVHVVNGRIPYALMAELYTDRGTGTEILRE